MCFGVFVQLNEGSRWAEKHPIGYVIQENGCWEWVGVIDVDGYGATWRNGTTRRAHRWMYEQVKGKIPKGLTIDHLCRNRCCVNPDHLEVVTNKENVLRGTGPTASNARKTHCRNGHPYAGNNLIVRKTTGERVCRECVVVRCNTYRRRKGVPERGRRRREQE